MSRLLLALVLVLAGALGLGIYMRWFNVSADNAGGTSNVTFSVDKEKIEKDGKTAVANVQDVGRQIKDKAAGNSHDGKVVSITDSKLVMTNLDGKEEHMHALIADIKITCDGKVCKVADLKPGMRVRVTTEKAEPRAATRIEALDNNRDFEKAA
jgi:preprotein translocase subunit SecF